MNVRHEKHKSSLGRFRWVIGTPYFVQGTSSITEVPILYFIKYVLKMGDAGGQLFDALRQSGWFVKPLWGLISDKVPLFGYHRKSWYVLMALAATLFWILNAVLAITGVDVPIIYLLSFNLAFATYAFVDMVCDALMVIRGRQLERVGPLINFQWAVLGTANAVSVFLAGWFQGEIQAGHMQPWLIFLLTGLPPIVTAVVGLRNIDEKPAAERQLPTPGIRRVSKELVHRLSRIKRFPAQLSQFKKRNRLTWLLILFIFSGDSVLPSVSSNAAT